MCKIRQGLAKLKTFVENHGTEYWLPLFFYLFYLLETWPHPLYKLRFDNFLLNENDDDDDDDD